MEQAAVVMKWWQCHKVVSAEKIVGISNAIDGGAVLRFEEGDLIVSVEFMRKHLPQVGGYFVVYEDGYRSFSPAHTFEAGYTLIDQNRSLSDLIDQAVVNVTNDIMTMIAKTAHEVNRAYCASIGDHSQKPWSDAPQWQKDSAIAGVKFTLENPNASPAAQHESWLEKKRADGWKFGLVKDEELKEHPCVLPYNELPKEQQVKDALFRAVVLALK